MPGKASQTGRRLTASRKFQIFLETRAKDAPVGEILRRWGLSPEQLREIEQVVEAGAVRALKVRSGRRALSREVTPEAFEVLRQELLEKEKALVELSVELALAKKGLRSGSVTELAAPPSRLRTAR